MPRTPRALLAALLVAPAALLACDEAADDPPIIILPGDMALEPDGALPPDAEPPTDAAPPDAEPPDAAPLVPPCSNPCDDGDPATTGDRCVDELCVGDPLPDLLVLLGDGAQGQPPPGEPAAPALRVALGPDGLSVQPLPWVVPRGHVSQGADGVWMTRTLDEVARTAVLRAGDDGFEAIAESPAVPGARVWQQASGDLVLAAEVPGPVVYLPADNDAMPLGLGLADDRAFIGLRDDALVALPLSFEMNMPWVVEPAPSPSLDGAQVLLGLGWLPQEDGTLVIDPVEQRTSTVAVSGPFRAAGDWLAQVPGSTLLQVGDWPPAAHAQPVEWVDARFVSGGLLALDGAGSVWWIALDGEAAAPVERGALPADAAFVGVHAGGVVARSAEGLWFVTAETEPQPLPMPVGELAGALDERLLVFVAPDRIEGIDLESGEMQVVEGAFGRAVGRDGAAMVVRGAEPAPLLLARLGAEGITPLADVWTPEPRTTVDDVDWVRLGGRTAAFIAEMDGPLVSLDLADPDAEPVPAARLRSGDRWSIGGVSADGDWVVWRAGGPVLGSLRGAHVDGRHFPDGIELLRSRAYPPLMAPTGARFAVAVDPRPSTGFPVIDLERDDPSAAPWVVSEGVGLSPLRWIDDASLLVSLCSGDLECESWGLGRVDLVGGAAVFAPLVGGDILPPIWGRSVMVVEGQLYYLLGAGLAQYELRRIPLDGRGPWTTVDRGAGPAQVHGPADGGVVYSIGGALKLARPAGAPIELELPGPLVGLGPLHVDRPLIVYAESGPIPVSSDGSCFDCAAWRIEAGVRMARLGERFMRPQVWSPAGDVLVHSRLSGAHIELAITDDTPGAALPWPAPTDADVRLLDWMP